MEDIILTIVAFGLVFGPSIVHYCFYSYLDRRHAETDPLITSRKEYVANGRLDGHRNVL